MTVKFKAPRIFFSGKQFYHQRRKQMIKTLNQCNKILCPSYTVLNSVKISGVEKEKLLYWPLGIESKHLSTSTLKKEKYSCAKPLCFGYTGTLSPQKGVEILLAAFSKLSSKLKQNTELRIYGNPDADNKTRQRVNKWMKKYAHPAIKFLGPYSRDNLSEIQQDLDVVIVPSTWLENRPLTILEAFASGNPVIGSNIGGIAEIITGTGAGWTFQSGNATALRNVLQTIIEDPMVINTKRMAIPEITNILNETENLLNLYRNYPRTD
ncbi:glycosyltransferase [bacterium]|nr:glycosyltransferase [bacterium]